ncbi:PAS domain S-box-containing protein [Modestobacter sp. DSM 44400]|uniref:SpoIIE family protein phosphatase n=1 Tax=Modestobacter sp. DSM 44400 TaxID=1550230 RepID=UPI000897749D|nr:SpoIIE family protein phosphatase [Modestobacter sp. DSM 44400]SDY18740.1 PAS domain S-box-containing protein [Modestobacter sp. DSM 44400]
MSPLDRDRVVAAHRVALSSVGSRGLQRLTDLTVRLLDAPSAGVSVVDDVQTVIGVTGWSAGTVGTKIPFAQSLGSVVVAHREPLVLGDARTDPRTSGLPRVRSGEIVAYLGVPLVQPGRGHVVGVLAVFGPQPRAWTDSDVALLAQLAESVSTELELTAVTTELEAARLRWGLAIDSAGIGSFDWDLVTGALSWDDRLVELFGYERADLSGTLDDFMTRLHPGDLERVSAALQSALDSCGIFQEEYRVVLPGGDLRWVQSRGRAFAGAGGNAVRFLGAAYDTTRSRHSDAQVARVLESMPAAFFSLGRDWNFTYVNVEAEKLLGADRDQLLGRTIWELFPAALDSTFEVEYRGAMASGEPTVFQAYYPPPLDSWYEVRVWPTSEGLSVYFLDITERRAADERARRSTERLALIAEVTAGFSTSLDGGRQGLQALATLARAVVPVLGDWAIVSVIEEDGRLRDVASWHWDPDVRDAAARYAQLRLAALTSTAPLVAALRTGEVMTVADVPDAVGRTLPPGEVRTVFDRLAPQTAVALPLSARGHIVGALTVYRSADRPAADAEDVATLREIADRAALALDNLQLYEQQRGMAAELQRSLLTDPVQPDHAEIAVRYSPAQRAAQVGGDWYDAFLQPDGATMLVIGDVVGHDTVAAAAMGQLRGLLRGIAFRGGAGPAEVLGDLDRAVHGLQVHTLATAAIARFEADDEERRRGQTRLRWSSAGHPPLMVLDPDGAVSVLASERADLLLGVDPSAPRREHELVLSRGSTVLLYTDGLVEGRDEELDAGIERLRGLFAELGPRTLGELCDGLVTRLRPAGSEDDVALVAIRLHPEDRPRPPEAGPRSVPPGQ